jgi:hypothetical protein
LDWDVEVLVAGMSRQVWDAMYAAFIAQGSEFHILEGMSHASCVELGDHFATTVDLDNVEDIEFELLMCIRPQYVVEAQFTSAWGEQFNVGDSVVQARYCQKWGSGP